MYEIALTVAACLRAGTRVDVAWAVTTDGLGPVDPAGALAITPGGGKVGDLLSGAVNDQLADLAGRGGGTGGRLVDLTVSDYEAQLAGLPGPGTARCVLIPATELPEGLWDRLRERRPAAISLRLDGDRVTEASLVDPETTEKTSDDVITSVFRPVPKLVIAGAGPIADALRDAAGLLGWQAQVVRQASAATGLIAGLAALDSVVVIGHDDDLTGAALAAALTGTAGYVGSIGPQRLQQARADWLAYRGITDLDRVHGPAGLDIGAGTPAEIALSILAEAVAVRSGKAG